MQNVWTPKAVERLIQHYVDETGIQDIDPDCLADWAEDRGYTMPPPLTGREVLSKMIRGLAGKARRIDTATMIPYRAMLAYSTNVQGEQRNLWFDADGPTATIDKVKKSVSRRLETALNIVVSARSTWERFIRTHPVHRNEPMVFGVSEQAVDWRYRGKGFTDDDQTGETKIG